jgi:hypothetical protein
MGEPCLTAYEAKRGGRGIERGMDRDRPHQSRPRGGQALDEVRRYSSSSRATTFPDAPPIPVNPVAPSVTIVTVPSIIELSDGSWV